jgi:hypothetical protein
VGRLPLLGAGSHPLTRRQIPEPTKERGSANVTTAYFKDRTGSSEGPGARGSRNRPDAPAGVPRPFHERLDNWKTVGELASEIIRQLGFVK